MPLTPSTAPTAWYPSRPGKQADLVVMDVDDYRKIPYYFAWNHCVMTIKRGL